MARKSIRTAGWILFMIAACIVCTTGCKPKQIPEPPTGSYLESIYSNANPNPDVEMFNNAMPPYLQYLDGLILSNKDELLLYRASGAYYGYSYCFAEDTDRKEASDNYLKARDYAMSELKRYRSFNQVMSYDSNLQSYKQALKYNFDKRNLPALYWTAMNWTAWINLNLDKADAIADIPKVEAMLEFITNIDGSYNGGSVYAALGSLHANRSKEDGGDPERAKEEFENAFTYSGNSYLTFNVMYAQFYATQVKDKDLFQKTLASVMETPSNTYADKTFVNEIAKRKAKLLLDNIDNYFKPPKEKTEDMTEKKTEEKAEEKKPEEKTEEIKPEAAEPAPQPQQ